MNSKLVCGLAHLASVWTIGHIPADWGSATVNFLLVPKWSHKFNTSTTQILFWPHEQDQNPDFTSSRHFLVVSGPGVAQSLSLFQKYFLTQNSTPTEENSRFQPQPTYAQTKNHNTKMAGPFNVFEIFMDRLDRWGVDRVLLPFYSSSTKTNWSFD